MVGPGWSGRRGDDLPDDHYLQDKNDPDEDIEPEDPDDEYDNGGYNDDEDYYDDDYDDE